MPERNRHPRCIEQLLGIGISVAHRLRHIQHEVANEIGFHFVLLDDMPFVSKIHIPIQVPHVITRYVFPMSGKLDREALPEPELARPQLAAPYEAPSGHAETTLADIWSRVLGVDRIGVNDNFFDLGGDSIQAGVSSDSGTSNSWSAGISSKSISTSRSLVTPSASPA